MKIPMPPKVSIARSFGRAAQSYDAMATLQGISRAQLVEWVQQDFIGSLILDLGAGTGEGALALERVLPLSRVVALDLSEGMMRQALKKGHRACIVGDAESLPVRDGVFDAVFSNMAIQWCASPGDVFRESSRILKPYGFLFFTSFGPETLIELKKAWQAVDGHVHVNAFLSTEALLQAVEGAGFTGITMSSTLHQLEYPDVMSLMRELKGIGANNKMPGRLSSLTGKDRLARMMTAYREISGEGAVPTIRATFEVITGCAQRPRVRKT